MDSIGRFEVNTIVIHSYKHNLFSLTVNDLKLMLQPQYHYLITDNTITDVHRSTADALVFILTHCELEYHKDLLDMKFDTWQQFFDVCFADIIINMDSDDASWKLAHKLRDDVDKYIKYYGGCTLSITRGNLSQAMPTIKALAHCIIIAQLLQLI